MRFDNLQEMKDLVNDGELDVYGNIYAEFDIILPGVDIYAHNIDTPLNLYAGNIYARSIRSRNIHSGNIYARSIRSRNIHSDDIHAIDIVAHDITYSSLNCPNVKCKSKNERK